MLPATVTYQPALQSWEFHKPSVPLIQPKDFRRMNKDCVIQGGTSAKDIAEYRRHHDSRIKRVQGILRQRNTTHSQSLIFGTKNRASTPIKKLIRNEFGDILDKVRDQQSRAVRNFLKHQSMTELNKRSK